MGKNFKKKSRNHNFQSKFEKNLNNNSRHNDAKINNILLKRLKYKGSKKNNEIFECKRKKQISSIIKNNIEIYKEKDSSLNISEDIKKIIIENNIDLIDKEMVVTDNDFDKKFKLKGYSQKSINYAKHIYINYLRFFINNINNKNQKIFNKDSKDKNLTKIYIFSFLIINNYFENTKYSKNTIANKYNNLSRTLQILSGKKENGLPKGIFIEHKKKDINIIPTLIFIDLSKELLKIKDLNFVILYQLCFIIGLNIKEITNIKFCNYNHKKQIIFFFRDNKLINRKLNSYLVEFLKLMNKNGDFDINNYIVYPLKNNIIISEREKFLFDLIKKFINGSDFLTKDLKKKLISDSQEKRKSRRLNISEEKNFSQILVLNKIIDTKDSIKEDLCKNINEIENFKYKEDKNYLINNNNNIDFIFNDTNNDNQFDHSFDSYFSKFLKEDQLEFKENINLDNEFIVRNQKTKFNLFYSDKNDKINGKEIKEKLKMALKANNIEFKNSLDFSINPEILNKEFGYLQNYLELDAETKSYYEKMKKDNKKGIYNNLELKEINNAGEYQIIATDDIKEGSLLFEVSGEVVSYEYLKTKSEYLKNKQFCYYYLTKNKLNRFIDFILINKFGNISYFVCKGSPISENVGTQAFFDTKSGEIILLAYSKTNIKKSEILKSCDIYFNLN